MEKLTEQRFGQNVIPLRTANQSDEGPFWAIDQHTEKEWFLRGAAADTLAAYEKTNYTPDEVMTLIQEVESRALLWFEKNYGVSAGRIMELAKADKEKRLLTLPCAMGSSVYTVKEDYFNCDECKHKADAKFRHNINRVSCDMENGQICPLYIQEHMVTGFAVGEDDAGQPVLSAPGEWGCEGLETFSGRDGKWHITKESAEAAKVSLEKGATIE